MVGCAVLRILKTYSMKRVIAIVAVFALLVSCGTTRKVQETKQTSYADSMAVQEVEKKELSKFIDTTRSEHGKITITEIEFEHPVPLDTPRRKPNVSPVSPPTTKAKVDNVGEFSGVKSIRQTVIESNVEEKGESSENEKQEQCKSKANAIRENSNIQIKESPAPDPNRWRYAFYVSLLLVAVLLYLKRVPILNWIKKILAGLRRIF